MELNLGYLLFYFQYYITNKSSSETSHVGAPAGGGAAPADAAAQLGDAAADGGDLRGERPLAAGDQHPARDDQGSRVPGGDPEANADCPRREHQEAAGNAAGQGNG